jgi:hypothetical protein
MVPFLHMGRSVAVRAKERQTLIATFRMAACLAWLAATHLKEFSKPNGV